MHQQGEGGIADGLRLGEDFADGAKICVVLGDNVLERSIRPSWQSLEAQSSGDNIMLKEVDNAERFGVA